MHGSPCLPAKDTSSDEKKREKRTGNLRIRDLMQKVIVDPATRRGKEILVYSIIVSSSPPRKSLVKGERFVRDEGDPEQLRVV